MVHMIRGDDQVSAYFSYHFKFMIQSNLNTKNEELGNAFINSDLFTVSHLKAVGFRAAC